jgi:predicted transposase/invertase (TIGR01784 family)
MRLLTLSKRIKSLQKRTKMVNEYADERYVRDEKEKAKKNKAIEIVKNSLKQNIDISTIALITGLSVKEIEKIQREF